MTDHDDAIDGLLTAMGLGESPPPGIDAQTRDVVERLYQASARVTPPPSFVQKLEETLMTGSGLAAASPGIRRPGLTGAQRAPESPAGTAHGTPTARSSVAMSALRRWVAMPHAGLPSGPVATLVGRLSVVAIVAIMVAVGVGVMNRQGNAPEVLSGISAIAPTVYPPASECAYTDAERAAMTVGERATETPGSLAIGETTYASVPRFPPGKTAVAVYVFPVSALPAGREPDATTRNAITSDVRRMTACRNAGALAWPAFLTTFGVLGTPVTGPATPAVEIAPIPVPDILSMSRLSDGRVSVLLAQDLYGLGLKMWLVYEEFSGAWLPVHFELAASDDWIAAGYRGATSDAPELHLDDTFLWPLELRIPAMQIVDLTVVNDGNVPHTFSVDGTSIRLTLAPGERTTIPINLTARGYRFTADIDPPSWSASGGYLWAIDPALDPSRAQP